jgi:hypothetical protein
VTNTSPDYPIGVFGITTVTSGTAIGVIGNNSSPDGFGVYGYSNPAGTGVRGEAVNGSGVWGSSVNWVGTYGYSDNYNGVEGQSGTGAGIAGRSTSSYGVYGESQSGPGVYGRSQTGLAALFEGRTSTQVLEITGGSDLAERFQVSDGAAAEPGTVMVIDSDNPGYLTPATTAYDRKVAGVVSGAGEVETGLVLHQEGVLEGETVVAIAGRVYVRAEAFSGPIVPGDMLTTSDRPGYAMVAADHERAQGAVIGKAMTGLESGTGLVLVLINLQ